MEIENNEAKSLEDSVWFIGTLAAVAIIASSVSIAAIWLGMFGGATK